MAKFLIYLFESGLCLSLFYIGYVAFFRKETYFTFNRIYLVASMVIALTLPLLPFHIKVSNGDYLTNTMQKLGDFRNYYEEIILITDPDYIVAHEETDKLDVLDGKETLSQSSSVNQSQPSSFNLSRILFYIYITGLLFFTIRLLLLFYNLYRIVRRSDTIVHNGFTIVFIKEELPSFSFLKWVFINKEALKPDEFEQVISHEKVHVEQKHSVDLILAHIITMFQWFNPLTWRIQKSIKTCHEYIADRQVIDQGHELFDYQSLLLSQLISIRSVELVNNFNLLSIKKRIAMMNKIKSGRSAKMKALLVVPMLLVAFFFFADMTGKSLDIRELNYSNQDNSLEGNWEAINKSTHQIQILEITGSKMSTIKSVVNNNVIVNDYNIETKAKKLILTNGKASVSVKYALNNDHLTIKWDDNNEVEYIRNTNKGTFVLVEDIFQKVSTPTAKSVKTFDYDYIIFSIMHTKDGFFFNAKKENLSKFNSLLKSVQLPEDKKKANKMSVLLEIDKDVKMKEVDQIKMALRENNFLKLGYVAVADVSTGIVDSKAALFNLLPPMDAKMFEQDDLDERGIKLFTINHSSSASLKQLKKQLHQHVMNNEKYVLLYEYSNSTSYNDYIQILDMVYSTIWNIRKEQAFFKGLNPDTMTKEEEKSIRKQYPITLTMRNVDEE